MVWLFYAVSAFGVLVGIHRMDVPLPRTFEPYGGILVVDGGETAPAFDVGARMEWPGATNLLGIRVLAPIGSEWSAGLEYGYARFEVREFSGGCSEEVEASCFVSTTSSDFHTLLAQFRRRWPAGPVDLHAVGGAGVLILKADEADGRTFPGTSRQVSLSDVAPPDFEAEVEPGFVLGAGASRALGSRAAIVAEGRDLVHLCRNDPEDYKERSSWFLCDHDSTLHHWQVTAGLQVRF